MPIDTVLLDRDGTVIADRHYLSDPAQVELLPGAGEALAALAAGGMRLFLVTNQSGIGRGYFSAEAFLATQRRLEELLAAHGVTLEAVAFCPHAPDDGCACRKPGTGMWEQLRRAHGLSPGTTVMIGDNAPDVAFAQACGLAEAVLVLTGHGERTARDMGLPVAVYSPEGWTRPQPSAPGGPTLLARDLAAAARWLLSRPA